MNTIRPDTGPPNQAQYSPADRFRGAFLFPVPAWGVIQSEV